jgi:peptidoglycan/xylan/chitin deacetylase (PgdA/CDA1 family)
VTRRRPPRAVVLGLATMALIVLLLVDQTQPEATAGAVRASTTTTSTSTTTTIVRDALIPPVTDGLAPLVTRLATQQPVVFLTIDDGAYKAPFELPLMQENGVRASLFLAHGFIRDNPGFFAPFVPAGNPIENHSIRHAPMPRLSYARQVEEICGEADLQLQQFGRRPVLFRPPGGAYNTDTRRAAAACGMRAVVTWIATVDNGVMHYQLGYALRPGDIVLMHFRPTFREDLQAFVTAMRAAGLHTELLEDWLA